MIGNMWPFNRRRRLQQRQRKLVVQGFSEYLSPESVDALARDPDRLRPRRDLRAAEIDFLILQVRDDVLEDVPKHLETAFRIVIGLDGTIISVMSSVMDVAFGIPIYDEGRDHADRCARAAGRLVEELDSNVRVVLGRSKGLYGVMGSEQRLVYGTVVPDFARTLTMLTSIEFGQLVRIPAAASLS